MSGDSDFYFFISFCRPSPLTLRREIYLLKCFNDFYFFREKYVGSSSIELSFSFKK